VKTVPQLFHGGLRSVMFDFTAVVYLFGHASENG